MLSKNDFLHVIEKTTLTSIDVIFYSNDKILLGYRNNSPAKGYWFTPGCRTYKNETQSQAIKRVGESEMGIDINPKDANFVGIYDQIYDDNFMNNNFGTHYVCCCYLIQLNNIPKLKLDEQHSNIKWMSIDEILTNTEVHKYVKEYIPDLLKIIK